MRVDLVESTQDPEINLVKIGRVSSSREDKTEEPHKLIRYLINNKHWSPFEHSFMTLKIVTSRAIATQLLRHRSFTFQQFSLRYAEAVGIEDIELRMQAKKNRQSSTEEFDPEINDPMGEGKVKASISIQEVMNKVVLLYCELLDQGVARECARMVLPLATKTTLYMTGSARSWIHMIELRDDEHAQKEVQLVARECKYHFTQVFPLTSLALGWIDEPETII